MTQIYERKGLPFVFKGVTDVTNCNTSLDVMEKAKLDWNVDICNLGAILNGEYKEANNVYGVYRTDKNIILGSVKGRYTPVQNTECFKFFDEAIGKNKAQWITAGQYGNGQKIFVSAKLPFNININNDIVENYLVFTNSHDGSSGVKILLTPVRLICWNMLNSAINRNVGYISFRHTKNVNEKISIASEIIASCKNQIINITEAFNQMCKIKIKDNQAQELFAKTILTETELNNLEQTGHNIHQIINRDWIAIQDSGISMKKVNTLTRINQYYYSGIGQQNIIGTGWGVYNAITGYYSNVDEAEGLKRMDSLVFGTKANKIEKVGNLILQTV